MWIGDSSIGDWDDIGYTFNGVVGFSKELYERDPNIINPKLFNYSNDEVFERVIKPLYYSLGLIWEEIAPLEEEYRIHFLTELFQIDTTHLLYVEKDDMQRCIWLDIATERLGDVILPRGYIQRTLREFVETFEKDDQAEKGEL